MNQIENKPRIGLVGAWPNPPYGWLSSITWKKKIYHLGSFDTEQNAHLAYLKAQENILAGRSPVKYGRARKKQEKRKRLWGDKHSPNFG